MDSFDWIEIPAGDSTVGATEEQKAILCRKAFALYENQLDERTQSLVEAARGKLRRRREQSRSGLLPKDPHELLRAVRLGPDALTAEEDEISKKLKHIFLVEATLEHEPQRVVKLDTFYVARFPFTEDQRAQVNGWETPRDPKLPAGANWYDADSFCREMGARLPTEEEWEKAARGPDGLMYPWGNEWDDTRGNFTRKEKAPGEVSGTLMTEVDAYPGGVSPYGMWDMCGNVYEWTMTATAPPPRHSHEDWYRLKAYPIKFESDVPWFDHRLFSRYSSRANDSFYIGFRPVMDKWPQQQWAGFRAGEGEGNQDQL